MGANAEIASVDAVPDDSTFLFTVRDTDTDEEKEAVLVRANGDIIGWLNYCQHFTHIKLDKGSGAPVRNGELVCANHGAYFEQDTGRCTFGPCEGAYLDEISVTVKDGSVFLTDENYDFVRPGAIETDPTDLSSKSNFEF